MKSNLNALVFAALFGAGATLSNQAAAAPNVVLWDTTTPLGDTVSPEDRTGWRVVPGDLLTLEADPPKASSDPGYYGREYSFQGDSVVETRKVSAVFASRTGRVILWLRGEASPDGATLGSNAPLGVQIAEILPLGIENSRITHVEIVRNAEDEVVLQVSFSKEGSSDRSCLFSFDRNGIGEIRPLAGMDGVRLNGSLQYAVAPSFIGDDLVFGPVADCPDAAICIPSEHMLVGLMKDESGELVLTWPQGAQSVKLRLGADHEGVRPITGIDFQTDGKALYLSGIAAPGIWHREVLAPSFLEKDVPVQWKRPFPARWKTQLYEEGVRTSFAFRPAKGQVWRGVPGSYNYPVWFYQDQAFFHLSKKVPPQGEALIYCLESQDTPSTVLTPADILQATLGRAGAEPILDVAGRKLRTHHRRGGDGVRRACTCGCTEAIQAVFEAGQEVNRKGYIEGALDDMVYFVHCHVDRIKEYQAFATDLGKFLESKSQSATQLKPFIESLQQIVAQIPQECEIQKENMKSFDYADDLSRRTMALTSQSATNNFKAYMELLKAWRDMGGAQDYVLARCHMITRSLCQEAGYGGVHQPESVALALEVRKRCIQCLRHPDGYEIWADY